MIYATAGILYHLLPVPGDLYLQGQLALFQQGSTEAAGEKGRLFCCGYNRKRRVGRKRVGCGRPVLLRTKNAPSNPPA